MIINGAQRRGHKIDNAIDFSIILSIHGRVYHKSLIPRIIFRKHHLFLLSIGVIRKLTMDKVMTWLRVMDVPFTLDKSTQTFVTEWDSRGVTFKVVVTCLEDGWIRVVAFLLTTDRISPEKKVHFFEELLRDNWRLEDVTYSIDSEGQICTHNDIPAQSNMENFMSEFNAVVYSAQQFWNNLEKYGIDPLQSEIEP